MANRVIIILCCIFVSLFLIRTEIRINNIEEKLDQIIDTRETINYTKHDLDCLAKNIYYEAGIEDKLGKYAVGHITVNRLKTGYWGKSICKVVYSKAQFSWTLKKKLPKPDKYLYEESYDIAREILSGARIKGLNNSLFYHADYIRVPKWADDEQKSMTIGRHIFYNKAKNTNISI